MCSNGALNTVTGGKIMPWSKTISGRVTNWAARGLGYDHAEDYGASLLKIGDYKKGAKYNPYDPAAPKDTRVSPYIEQTGVGVQTGLTIKANTKGVVQ
jgi:hypothetical protein